VTIKSIEIKNIKGISHKKFELDLIPNKPNLLVAPNGFGKSSFAVALDSMNLKRINLHKDNYHEKNDKLSPEINIVVCAKGVTERCLSATNTSNEILKEFDIKVINSQLKAKATKKNMGGFTQATASMEVNSIVLIDTIPKKTAFNYKVSEARHKFGSNGKILPNILSLLSNTDLLDEIVSYVDLKKFNGKTISKKIDVLIENINKQSGSTDEIKKWIEANQLHLSPITYLPDMVEIINRRQIYNLVDSYLSSIQIIDIYKTDSKAFTAALSYNKYLKEKEGYIELLKSLDTTRFSIKPKEDKKKGLIVHFPKAHEFSNGERDVLSFVMQLERAKNKLKQHKCILVIDEIFDYLDDANLIVFQYYVTRFIDDFKKQGKELYPILMTHLDPYCFKHFCFNRHKLNVRFLSKRPPQIKTSMKNLIKKRDDESIKDNTNKYHFHYNPEEVDLQNEFHQLGLKKSWGKSHLFYTHIHSETRKYLNSETDYDPFAVCFSLRIKIEEIIYRKLESEDHKSEFLEEHGTKKKLYKAIELGYDVLDSYFLLGLIYNDNLHWHDNRDNESPILTKLDNLIIKKMIKDIFNTEIE
jgi:hypothetical protein